VAVDEGYIEKLSWTYATWMHFKKEMRSMPLVVLFDEDSLNESSKSFDVFSKHEGGLTLVPWRMDNAESQREKMLSSLVFGIPDVVKTPWYLKIDADTIANSNRKWIDPGWFTKVGGERPAFVTNSWNYTKPAIWIDQLNEWADKVDQLKNYPDVEYTISDDGKRAYHSRIISWLFFGNTEWTKNVVSLLDEKRMPVPSQDTFLHFCAQRSQHHYVTARMSRNGWGHAGRKKTHWIANECMRLING
jgi:hypothetical protein